MAVRCTVSPTGTVLPLSLIHILLKAGQPIELTQVEFQIMELFFRNPGIALVREKILKDVYKRQVQHLRCA